MLINIVCIESSRPDWTRQAFESYQSKFYKSIQINWKGCKPIQRNKNYDVEKTVRNESELLLSNVQQGDIIISLDRRGKNIDTLKLKDNFESWLSSSKNI